MPATISVVNSITLDGVMQAPGGPDEDTRGGFEHGGWAGPYMDQVLGEYMGKGMAGPGSLLFGHRTYDQFFSFWPSQTDNPFTPVLNGTQKYVVSRDPNAPTPWERSTLLAGDAAETVAELKASTDEDLTILGSGELVRTLVEHDLIDDYVLVLHPLVLGTGTKLFADDGAVARLELVESVPTTTGVLITRYRPAR
jgi:dihydrofolate reductase